VKILVLDQQLLVDFGCLLEVAPQVVQCSHTKLIFNCVAKTTVQIHNLIFIT
jgi:hypothetical protein